MIKNTKHFMLIASTSIFLTACQTAQSVNTPTQSRAEAVDAAMERSGTKVDSDAKPLSVAEEAYKRNSDDEKAALDYAAALRKNDFLNRAAIVLKPFAAKEDSSSAVKTEYAAIALAQGQYQDAEKYAQKAIVQDDKNAEAYHYLGIALDARGEHEKGERAFRKGLDLWEGDPTTIMNNLALNLASQGYLDEAAEILHKAKSIAPYRAEVERNLRIITALQQSKGIPVPKPRAKPVATTDQE